MVDRINDSLTQARTLIGETWGQIQPYACLVCGSGWGEVAEGLSPISHISYEKLIGMGMTTVDGHYGKLWLANPNGREILIFQGRRHYYEGEGWEPVVFPALLAHELGAKNLLLTNAAGGIRRDFNPGDLMVLTDHLNFMGSNPLVGRSIHSSIPRFPDQSEIYDAILRDKILLAGKNNGLRITGGTYVALCGPAFETPAEIDAFARLGADAVGMSTVPEAMVANGLGLKVGAVSCISNLAAGRSDGPLGHEEVMEVSQKVLPEMTRLLAEVLRTI